MADIASITKTDALTMSSKEIAELTGKQHKNVLADIDKMLDALNLPREGYAELSADPQNGQSYRLYRLPKNLTLNLVTGYRADMRLKIIDRWLELEGRPQPKHEIPQTLGEALRLAAAENDMRLAAESKVAALAPKAEALDRITLASGEYGLTEAAKILQVKPKKFFDWLDANRCRYGKGNSKLAYQDKIDAGYFRNRASFYTDPNGEQQAGNTIRVTPKGLAWLAQVVPGAVIDRGIVPEESQPLSSIAGYTSEFRMDAIAMDVAFRAMLVIASGLGNGKPSGTTEFMREKAKTAARAVMQIWGDLERLEQRALI